MGIDNCLRVAGLGFAAVAATITLAAQGPAAGWTSADLLALRRTGDVQVAPDGSRVAYTVLASQRSGRASSQIWVYDVKAGTTARLGGDRDLGTNPRWSPDSQSLAFTGRIDDESGLAIQRVDGTPPLFLTRVVGSNHPVPGSGEPFVWSPGSSRIAYVTGTPGPEAADADGDPMVVTRYLYKPGASEGLTRFNDNRRLQIWMVDLVSHDPRPLTQDAFYNHSLDWSPKGDEILFVSNREAGSERVFNPDVFAVSIARGDIRRLTDTKSAEYEPRWSPDGAAIAMLATTRPFTSSETTMEDTHVWVMRADGKERRELGAAIDNRQGPPRWSSDGKWLYFTVQERGDTRLYRLASAGTGPPEAIAPAAGQRGSVGAWSLSKGGTLAFAMTTPDQPGEVFLKDGDGSPRAITTLNSELTKTKPTATVEAFSFKAADGRDIEAFLTKPAGLTATSRHPLVVTIHGGPHGQQGPAFNLRAQAYASRGWASLMVNYRGSTGYGQAFADAIARDQNGAEARDVLSGVEAALARYPWIDPARLVVEGGSYGGQLVNWIVTQTDRFKAAVPTAGIANLVSFNYTAYYHDYLAVEFGGYPHEAGLMDELWARSPLRFVRNVKTPTLILHGENDNDVPVGEAEQWYIALQDVGVETVFVRYPREGHGLSEPRHQVDALDRTIGWYEKAFAPPKPAEPAKKAPAPPKKK